MKKIILMSAIAASALLTSCNNGAPKANLRTQVDTLSYLIGMAMSPADQLSAYLTQIGSDSAYQEEFLKGMRDGMLAGDDKKKMAYFNGVQAGLQTKMQTFAGIQRQIFGEDSTKELSVKNFLSGFAALMHHKTALKIDTVLVDQEKARELASQMIEKLSDEVYAKQYAHLQVASDSFMTEIGKRSDVKPAGEGVYYKVIKEGNGDLPTPTSTVTVKYEGRLMDGTVFDSSGDTTRDFNLQSIIKGWSTALVKMPVGSQWEIYIPYNMGYGIKGNGQIPPYSALVFTVELVGLK